jgi:hypothetical protein
LYPNGPHVSNKNIPLFPGILFPLSFLSPLTAGDAHTAAAATWLHHALVPVAAQRRMDASATGEPAEDSEATVSGAGVHRGWEA